MARRKRFEPMPPEGLEDRIAMSRAGAAGALHAAATAPHPPTPAPAVTVGAMGDSYTDEYRFHPPDQSRARNWVEILAATNKANFGPFSTATRGEPRDQGFATNWARYGSTSGQLVANQLPGLKAQVAKGQVQYAWIFTGGDDFLYFLQGVQRSGSNPDPFTVLANLARTEKQAEANFTKAVDTLLAANPRVKLVVATVPDVAGLPIVQRGVAGNPGAQLLIDAASVQIRKYNAVIRAAAHDPRVALADLAGAAAGLFQGQVATTRFGGVTIDLATPGDDYHHAFLADGIHVGTVVQGVIADAFIKAIDAKFGARVAQLSPTQIVDFARNVRPDTP